jgi:HK97 gp10 family phage protein
VDAHFNAAGVRRLQATLTRKEGTVGAQAARALRKTAHDIEADAKALAPVDTGALKNSISTDISGDGRFASMHAEIGPTVDYAHFVEAGTSRMGPQPYMRPAAERRFPGFRRAILDIGGDIL